MRVRKPAKPTDVTTLAEALHRLESTRTLDDVTAIVRRAARVLTGAEGASFVLREGDSCFYVDEDAISPLWKGKRFPLEKCVSGWVMTHASTLVIEDIYSDPRVLWEAYHPTFVKSLALAPIRREQPIGAVGLYWAMRHTASAQDVATLESLALGASSALERVDGFAARGTG